jgi:hypothetical protein
MSAAAELSGDPSLPSHITSSHHDIFGQNHLAASFSSRAPTTSTPHHGLGYDVSLALHMVEHTDPLNSRSSSGGDGGRRHLPRRQIPIVPGSEAVAKVEAG